MDVAGALSLPLEVVHHISRYLSVKDTLNCSLTCYYLRAALNDNEVWEKYLPAGVVSLDTREQLVEPGFSCRESLIPPCANWIWYMKSVYIKGNMRTGQFVHYSSNIDSTVLMEEDFSKQNSFIYKEKFVFLSYLSVNSVTNRVSKTAEVWDIHKEPKLHCALTFGSIVYSNFFVIESYFVCCWKFNSQENCRVDVYKITLPKKEFPILYSFSVTGKQVDCQKYKNCFSTHSQKSFGWTHFTIGCHLVSRLTSGESRMVFHIWNIPKQCKVGSFLFPEQVSSISVQPSFSDDKWFFKGENPLSCEQIYHVFSLNEKKFSVTAFKYKCSEMKSHAVYYKSKVLLLEELVYPTIQLEFTSRLSLRSSNPYSSERFINCTLYDFSTSKEIVKRCFNTNRVIFPIKSIEIIDGKFIMLAFNCFHFIDALTLSTLEYFECDVGFHCVIQQCSLFQSTFVLLREYDDKLCLWNIKNKTKLPNKYVDIITSGSRVIETFSDIVVIGKSKINVIHFW